MALGGGTWQVQNKVLPGYYVNFSSVPRASAALSDRGFAAAPFELSWGPEGEVFAVTSGEFQKNSKTIFGYAYDHPKMLPLREIFTHATTVYCYRLGSGAVKASNTLATAKYGGVRGNDITIVVAANVDEPDLWDVTTYAAKSKRQAARSPYGKSIENRPQDVKGRGSFGHWEMDSIMGCKGSKKALLVLTERRTRMGIVMLLEDHTAASVVKAINSLERRFGKLFYKLFKSITVDNGCEFQDFEGIEAAHRRKGKRTIVFFCHPYSAFERGSNENMNRLIRRFFPKGTSFDTVKPEEVRAAERWVNNYPRKLLGWKSAAMLFEKELLSA